MFEFRQKQKLFQYHFHVQKTIFHSVTIGAVWRARWPARHTERTIVVVDVGGGDESCQRQQFQFFQLFLIVMQSALGLFFPQIAIFLQCNTIRYTNIKIKATDGRETTTTPIISFRPHSMWTHFGQPHMNFELESVALSHVRETRDSNISRETLKRTIC